MYNLNGIELDLNEETLKEYSKLTIAEVGTEHFNNTLMYLAEMMLQTENFEKAVYLYGKDIVSKKITEAIKDELNTFTVEYE